MESGLTVSIHCWFPPKRRSECIALQANNSRITILKMQESVHRSSFLRTWISMTTSFSHLAHYAEPRMDATWSWCRILNIQSRLYPTIWRNHVSRWIPVREDNEDFSDASTARGWWYSILGIAPYALLVLQYTSLPCYAARTPTWAIHHASRDTERYLTTVGYPRRH